VWPIVNIPGLPSSASFLFLERSGLGKELIVRRQFMRGTDPIKSKWECLILTMYEYIFYSF
jgi:hypothetical protein